MLWYLDFIFLKNGYRIKENVWIARVSPCGGGQGGIPPPPPEKLDNPPPLNWLSPPLNLTKNVELFWKKCSNCSETLLYKLLLAQGVRKTLLYPPLEGKTAPKWRFCDFRANFPGFCPPPTPRTPVGNPEGYVRFFGGGGGGGGKSPGGFFPPQFLKKLTNAPPPPTPPGYIILAAFLSMYRVYSFILNWKYHFQTIEVWK